MSDATTLGAVSPAELADARLQLHYAAQVPAAVGHALIAPRDDDSQSNLGWNDSLDALVGHATPQGFRVGLRCRDMTVLILGADGHIAAEHALDGRTLDDGLTWVSEELARLTGKALPARIQLRDYDLPEHPVADGKAFTCVDAAACEEIGRWFAHGDAVLRDAVDAYANVSDARVWPHHFDMGVLITLDPGADPEKARSVGLGLSPGDDTIPEPYWYAYAYPTPTVDTPPEIAGGGVWSTEGFTGPLLRGSQLVERETGEAQLEQAHAFLNSAANACHALLSDDRR